MSKYSVEQFNEDLLRIRQMAENSKVDYIGYDKNSFKVSFKDDILGLKIEVYLSKMTICINSKCKSNNMQYLKNQSWEQINSIMKSLYNYI